MRIKLPEKRELAIGLCAVAVIGGAVFLVGRSIKKRRGDFGSGSPWDLYREGYRKTGEDFKLGDSGDSDIPVNEDAGNAAEADEEDEADVEEVPSEYKVVADGKPDLSEVARRLQESVERMASPNTSTNQGGSADEDGDILEGGTEADEVEPPEGIEEEIDVTPERVSKLRWDEDSLPIFSEEEWDSEDGSIELISQKEYLESYLNHNKEQAVWFSKSSILVDTLLKPMEVVDTVGPTAFTSLMRDHTQTIFVKNNELLTDYELFVNEDSTIEEAWEDQGVE